LLASEAEVLSLYRVCLRARNSDGSRNGKSDILNEKTRARKDIFASALVVLRRQVARLITLPGKVATNLTKLRAMSKRI
jgi:hypothetical protein